MKGTSISFTPFVRVATIVLLGSILAGCNQANSEITKEVIKPVKLLEIPMPANQASNAFPGKLEATQRAQLSFQVPGEIEKLTVRVGQRVEQGQVLAVLDDQDYRLAFDAKLAEFELAQSQFQRAKQLYGKKLISTDQFDQRETAYKAAAANLEQAKTDVEHTLIKAPFNGVVSLKFVNQNQFVGANQPVMNIQNVDEMDVSFNLPVPFVKQTSLSAIRQTVVWVEMDNHPAQQIQAEFKELSTKPDADTNSYTAKVTLSRPEAMNLLSGMVGQVHFAKPELATALRLPEGAWVEKQNGQGTLWQFDPATGVVDALQVVLNDEGEVVSGLAPGNMVVIAGATDLLPGQQVRAWEREGGI
ncbi:efflux RND transporter periplasmic adaptor subunit [Photobacterium sp. BZF1]|uniref:efflux RND transporter periplasmic adaptor subunit n=1 Tax=Photobacterium sp. BZF1 TaxID=1904457 RepID=UPI00351C9677